MIKVVKIGGNVVDNPELLRHFCKEFATLEGPKVLVHGGGVMASQMQKALGMEPCMVEGRRVTDEETLKIVTMVYAGWCNKHITALLQAEGCNACGISGCDGGIITAKKRAPRTLSDGKTVVDYGFVGDVTPECVDADLIRQFIVNGAVPVFCAINHDGNGNLLNTNADTMACSIAAALRTELIYCFEKKGVLLDVEDENSIIKEIDPEYYEELKEKGVIAAGMLPKLENSFKSLKDGATRVTIKHSDDLLDPNAGTKLNL